MGRMTSHIWKKNLGNHQVKYVRLPRIKSFTFLFGGCSSTNTWQLVPIATTNDHDHFPKKETVGFAHLVVFIELDDGKIFNQKALCLMVKTHGFL